MKNSLGNPARGEAFYDREKEIKKIYKVLETGASIYLSAPRRVGKTSILKHLEEFPQKGYYFIYIITESVDRKNEFFKIVFEELVKSDAIKKLAKVSSAVKDTLTGLLSKVKKISDIEFREGEDPDYFELLLELFSNVNEEHGRIVIMIDEFPQTILNILEKNEDGKGKESAQNFLQKNRELRHHKNCQDKINFIYTGSVSLFPMVEIVTSLTAINDLRTVDVEPLEQKDAEKFLSLLLENDGIVLNEQLLKYITEKIKWLIPFHLQMIEQEIVDVFESSRKPIDKEAIEKAFDQIIHTRNRPQFEPYFSRLAKIFKNAEYEFVMEVLKTIAQNDAIESNELHDIGVKYGINEIKTIIAILEGDGYIFSTGKTYNYTSPLLQLWCKKTYL